MKVAAATVAAAAAATTAAAASATAAVSTAIHTVLSIIIMDPSLLFIRTTFAMSLLSTSQMTALPDQVLKRGGSRGFSTFDVHEHPSVFSLA